MKKAAIDWANTNRVYAQLSRIERYALDIRFAAIMTVILSGLGLLVGALNLVL